jgi:hypothetical protein
MHRQISEPDWKVWRRLSPVALERFCEQALDEVVQVARAPGAAHTRYRQIFQVLQHRDEVVAAVFDDQRRSNAFFQIARAVGEGMLPPSDIAFSLLTRRK